MCGNSCLASCDFCIMAVALLAVNCYTFVPDCVVLVNQHVLVCIVMNQCAVDLH